MDTNTLSNASAPDTNTASSANSVHPRPEQSCGREPASSCSTYPSSSGRGGVQGSTAILNTTPLSGLQSSGSLLKHLAQLRKKQQDQRRKLGESIQSASPNLDCSNQHSRVSVERRKECLEQDLKPKSLDTTTHEAQNISHMLTSLISAGESKSVTRLPLNVIHDSDNKKSFDQSHNSDKHHNLNINPNPCDLENTPPQTKDAKKSISFPNKQYNPNTYRSPPKNVKRKIEDAKSTKDQTPFSQHALTYASPLLINSVCSSSSQDTCSPSLPAMVPASGHFITSPTLDHSDRPISFSRKPFEDLIIEKLNAGVYRTSSTDTPAPKKQFLKKGVGVVRYTSQDSVEKSKNVETLLAEKDYMCNEPKRRFPYLKKGFGAKRFNCKSNKIKVTKTNSSLANATSSQSNPMNRINLNEPSRSDISTPMVEHGQASKNNLMFVSSTYPNTLSPILRKDQTREIEELKAFEKLEELAENSSFSSNASTINSLLQKGLEKTRSSTPVNSPSHRYNINFRKSIATSCRFDNSTDRSELTVQRKKNILPNPSEMIKTNNQLIGVAAHSTTHKPSVLLCEGSAQDKSRRVKSVQFCEQGAQILEYCPSENDTVSEIPTMSDTSEFLNISDLEALNQLHQEGRMPHFPISVERVVKHTLNENRSTRDAGVDRPPFDLVSAGEPITAGISYVEDRSYDSCSDDISVGIPSVPGGPRHTVLQFSPPRIPPDAASYPVWEAFGSRSVAGSAGAPASNKTQARHGGGGKEKQKIADRMRRQAPPPLLQKKESSEQQQLDAELESQKVLLVSKVHELESEIKTFQTENAQLNRLKSTLAREQEQLNKERRMFEITLAEDRRKIENYFEIEKNKLWREKCALESSKQNEEEKCNTLEVINLKEEILLLKKELDKRDSMHNFTQNKLREKIKELDRQKREFEKKIEKLNVIEKENLNLKHQVDRIKLSNRLGIQKSVGTKPAETLLQKDQSVPGKSSKFTHTSQPEDTSVVNINSKLRNMSSFMRNVVKVNSNDITEEDASNNCSPFANYLKLLPGLSSSKSISSKPIEQFDSVGSDSTENVLADGSIVVTYANGNKKQIMSSGCVVQEYYNGDKKETYKDKIVYTYAENNSKQTTHHDGVEELEFPNGQREIRRPDGSVEVVFADGTRRCRLADSSEVYHSADGTVIRSMVSGEKLFEFCSGQREVHGPGFKRREYPDGTVKVLYDDGTTQTTYPNGRVRVKSKQGKVLSDSKMGIDYNTDA